MARRIESVWIPGPAGRLEGLLEEPEHLENRIAAVLCHPHPQFGGTMHNKVVYRLERGLRAAGVVVLRFNFRGVGRSEGSFGNFAGEVEDARAALGWMRERYPELPFAMAGFSFGSRVITQLGCESGGARFLLACGFSTRLGGSDFLASCKLPKVFIQSTHDEFAPRADFEREYAAAAEPKRVNWIEAQDHFFAGSLEQLEMTVRDAASEWI